jgi:hypothetical protein
MYDVKEFAKVMGLTGALILAIILSVTTPIAWFDGHAKSDYLKQTRGLNIPWYEATFLTVRLDSVDAELKTRK